MEPLFDLPALEAATELVRRWVPPTPQQRWPLLEIETGVETWVKHEDCTPVGAFKVRGGLVHLAALQRRSPQLTGVVSATRGNHGQSLAFAGRELGIPVTIVVPEGNNPEKNAAMQALGADLVVSGHDFEAARGVAAQLAVERALTPVPAFHPELVLGVATYALELFRTAPVPDVVYVPIGMGSGAAAMVTVRDLLGLATRVVGVVATGAPAYALSFEAGAVVATEAADTFVDGVACRAPDAAALEVLRNGLDAVVHVPDDETRAAMRVLLRTTHHLVEPAGAIGLAALLRDRPAVERAAVVVTGGNVDAATLAQVLASNG